MTTSDFERRNTSTVTWALAGIAGALALYILATTLYWTSQTFEVIPLLDQWAIVFLAQFSEQPNFLPHLWEQHNEHRILIPRLISLLDYAWFSGQGYFDLVCIWLFQIGTAAIVFVLGLRAMAPLSDARAWRAFALAVVIALFFSVTQIDNLAFPFQTCFLGQPFFTALAFYCMDRSARIDADRRAFSLWVGGAALASWGSMLCLASGIFTPLVLIVGGYLVRWPKRVLAAVTVAAAVSIFVYLHGYTQIGEHGKPLEALAHPGTVLMYIAVYLGSMSTPGDLRGVTISAVIGVGVLAILLTVIFRLWRTGLLIPAARAPSPAIANIALLGIVAVSGGQALITALGRYNLGIDQAMSGRYYSVRLLIWACLLLMAFGVAARARLRREVWIGLAAALSACIVVALAAEQRTLGKAAKNGGVVRQIGTDSLLTGVIDPPTLSLARADADVVLGTMQYLSAKKLSLFASRWYAALGQPIQSVATVRPPETCTGWFETASIDGVNGGAKVEGWGWSVADGRPFDRIVLADTTGRIVGLATTGLPRVDIRMTMPNAGTDQFGWRGYTRAGDNISAYGIIDGKFACKLPGSWPLNLP